MDFTSLKETALQDDKVKSAYDELTSEFSIIDQLLSMRSQARLTQEQLAERMHTQKSNISV